MNDDEFFSQFPATPRPEFAEGLRAKLARIEASQEGITMDTSAQPATSDRIIPMRHPSRDRAMTLVATLILVLFIGSILMVNANYGTPAMPVATVTPSLPTISRENAAQLHSIAQVGRGTVSDAFWTQGSQTIAVLGSAGIWVYAANDLGQPLYNIFPDQSIYAGAVLSRDGHLLVFNSADGLHVWDFGEQRDVTPEFADMPAGIGAIALNSDGHILALADRKSVIYFYSIQSGRLLSSHQTLGQRILDLEFRPDGKQLAFVSDAFPLLTLDDPSGAWQRYELGSTPLYELQSTSFGSETFTGAVTLVYSDDGTRLAVRSSDMVRIWDTTTGHEVSRLTPEQPSDALGTWKGLYGFDGEIAFNADATKLVTTGSQIRLWDLATQTSQTLYADVIGAIRWETTAPDPNDAWPVSGRVRFSPDGTRVLSVSDGALRVNDSVTGDSIASFYDYEVRGFDDLSFSPDSTQLATWGDKHALYLWNINAPSTRFTPRYLSNSPYGDFDGRQRLAFSPDNRFLATYLDNGDIQLWTRDGKDIQHWISPSTTFTGFATGGFIGYSADGTRLVSKAPDSALVWLWDTSTGKIIQTITVDEGERVVLGALSPDARFVALALGAKPDRAAQRIVIYDTVTGKAVKTLAAHKTEVSKLVYSTDGTRLLSAAGDGSAYLWNTHTDDLVSKLQEDTGNQAVAFSPDGTLIAGVETRLKMLVLWDVDTGNVIMQQPLPALAQALAFSSDGAHLAVGLDNGTIQILGVVPAP